VKIRAVKGVKDILPEEMWKWRLIERASRTALEEHGYSEIRIPIFEYTELFSRSIGEATDIVEKEMYSFQDSKGVSISLRPEGTAGVVRACIEHSRLTPDTLDKLYYMGPMFRHERPQKGRYRQFFQIGAEAIGSESPQVDVEILSLLHLLFQRLGIEETSLEINSLGCPECRPQYREALKDFLGAHLDELCDDCRRRYENNPLRILDCKKSACKEAAYNAPESMTTLCTGCMDHFEKVKVLLTEMGIPFKVNERLVRGLDYYTRTTFEILTDKLGAQNAVAAGGRYDGLVQEIGGRPTPAMGFALGVERIAALLPDDKEETGRIDFFLAALGGEAMDHAPLMLFRLRSQGVRAETSYQARSLKSQMRQADRLGARFVGMLGEKELNRGVMLLRNMKTKNQQEVPLDQVVEKVTRQIQEKGPEGSSGDNI
jgi:histidyl-tRNA synthetase